MKWKCLSPHFSQSASPKTNYFLFFSSAALILLDYTSVNLSLYFYFQNAILCILFTVVNSVITTELKKLQRF